MFLWLSSVSYFCLPAESRLHHLPRSVGPDVTGSTAPVSGERKSSAPVHSSQPVLFTFDVPVRHSHHGSLSNSAPQDYLLLHQCMSRKTESARWESRPSDVLCRFPAFRYCRSTHRFTALPQLRSPLRVKTTVAVGGRVIDLCVCMWSSLMKRWHQTEVITLKLDGGNKAKLYVFIFTKNKHRK